jgi:FKBP-type peptidyl-prolyl cis-trans isomerase FkpA
MKFLWAIIIPLVLFSCKKESIDEQYVEDIRLIESYITVKGLQNVQKTDDGLHYIIFNPGTGDKPSGSSKIKINYVGRLMNDHVFDSNFDTTFELSGLIQGWQIGIPLISEGGSIKLIIPSKFGYGTRSTGTIPPNSVLIFDIDLLEIDPE